MMKAPLLMVCAAFLFAMMGVCVKLAAVQYSVGEIVFYRGLVGSIVVGLYAMRRGGELSTRVPTMHFWRSVTGVSALFLWFYSMGNLPLATATTLNYSSSIWVALIVIGSAGFQRFDVRLMVPVVLGFVGVMLILQPTMEQDQLWHGLVGLLSGVVSATAYSQLSSLGGAGEPDYRVVFYFSLGGILAGALLSSVVGWHAHTTIGVLLLLLVGVLATVAQLLMTRAYATGRPLVNASLQYLGIAFSYGWGVVIFNEQITALAVAGMVTVVAASVLSVQYRSRVTSVEGGRR